jgi:hypothetical protein
MASLPVRRAWRHDPLTKFVDLAALADRGRPTARIDQQAPFAETGH